MRAMVTPDRASACVRIVGSVAERATERAVLGEPAELIRTRRWGPLAERRVALPSGLEIEFGFVPPGWASVDPVDPGTARVVADGCSPVHDPLGAFTRLIAAVGGP